MGESFAPWPESSAPARVVLFCWRKKIKNGGKWEGAKNVEQKLYTCQPAAAANTRKAGTARVSLETSRQT